MHFRKNSTVPSWSPTTIEWVISTYWIVPYWLILNQPCEMRTRHSLFPSRPPYGFVKPLCQYIWNKQDSRNWDKSGLVPALYLQSIICDADSQSSSYFQSSKFIWLHGCPSLLIQADKAWSLECMCYFLKKTTTHKQQENKQLERLQKGCSNKKQV